MKENTKILYLIPARGGSKGLPKKNIKVLAGKPLIYYSINAALSLTTIENICVSTDSPEIKKVAEEFNIDVPFLRPDMLASDSATTEDVILHALDFYKRKGVSYDFVVLLQPTSPLRKSTHIKEALSLIKSGVELIVSVKETDSNPYYVLFEENNKGVLEKSKKGVFTRRQDCPVVYELNGAVYVISVKQLKEKGYQNLKMLKFVMSKESSVDIDDEIDFKLAELLMKG